MTDRSAKQVAASSRAAGFTLIELMVVVAIIAILAAIALPYYGDYVKQSKIPEGTAALSDARVKLEQYYQDNPLHSYKNFTCPDSPKNFTLKCDEPTDNTYLLTASGNSATGMGDFEYTLDQTNAKVTTKLPSDWTGKGSACWVTRKNGSC
jgi:type IV pilus assembly protein PilE